MAFMGIFISLIFLIILVVVGGGGIILLIGGFALRIKGKKMLARFCFVIGGLCVTAVVGVVIFAVIPHPIKVETPDGYAKIKPSWYKKYNEYLDSRNIEGLEKLVDKHPELIYYYDANFVMLLDYGLYNCDVEIMEIAVKHGAKFDEPLRYDHMVFYSSLHSFYGELDYPSWEKDPDTLTKRGTVTDKMINAVDYAIKHGAKTEWKVNHDYETDNFYQQTLDWVNADGKISEKDEELLNIIPEKVE